MVDAIWLMLVVPKWFLSSFLHPLALGPISLAAVMGTICLVVGVMIGRRRGQTQLLIFLLPLTLCELFAAIAGFSRGHLSSVENNHTTLGFLIFQASMILVCLYWSKRALLPALLIAFFCAVYVYFTAFVSSMSFTDTWL